MPPVVTPAPSFSHGAGAPADAVVLFSGQDLSAWKGEGGKAVAWKAPLPADMKKLLAALRRGECDVAAMHLFDPETGRYNAPFLAEGMSLAPGWRRLQGVVFRRGDARFEGRNAADAVADATPIGAGGTGSKLGVGVSIGLNVVPNTTRAEVEDGGVIGLLNGSHGFVGSCFGGVG